jgi:hypothetical protein
MIGGNFDAVLVFFNADVCFGKSLDDLVELLCRQRQRSALCNGRLAFASQRNLKVGCKHPNFIAFGLEQHVREDRNRILALDNALEKLQFSQKLCLADN